jgi:hypothetical protein
MDMKSTQLHSHHSTVIHRSVEDVYQFVAVDFFRNYQKWSPEVRELEPITAGAMRVGVTGRQVRYDRGYRSESTFRVTRMTPLRELRFESLTKPEFDVCYRFEPAAMDTRISFEFQLRLPLFMLPLRERVADIVEHDGGRIVSNIRTLLQG